ncbi:MAG: LuxR C-terminal-related transcriptional regulator [Bacteroidota bacterium]
MSDLTKKSIEKVTHPQRSDTAHRQFMDFWKKEQAQSLFANEEKYLKQTALLEELADDKGTLYVLFDLSRYKILYFGQNMETIFGYRNSELKKRNIQLLFRALPAHQLFFPMTLAKWRKKVYAGSAEQLHKMKIKFTYCGLRIKHKKGHEIPLLVQYHSISKNEQGQSVAGLVTVDDATHLLKANFYWARSSCEKNKKCIGHYHSKRETGHMNDIISEREKEILRLIALGHRSKKIGEQLFITQNTVEKHRKNMLARTGAKDTTALVHICRRFGII